MSQKNVEIVRRFYEAGQRSLEAYWKNPRPGAAAMEAGDLDPETVEVLAFLHPEVELNPRALALTGGAVRGHLAWLKSWDELLAASEYFRMNLAELADLGGGEALVATDQAIKWRGSGMELKATVFYLVTLREGLIVRIDSYRDRTEALEAVGLSE